MDTGVGASNSMSPAWRLASIEPAETAHHEYAAAAAARSQRRRASTVRKLVAVAAVLLLQVSSAAEIPHVSSCNRCKVCHGNLYQLKMYQDALKRVSSRTLGNATSTPSPAQHTSPPMPKPMPSPVAEIPSSPVASPTPSPTPTPVPPPAPAPQAALATSPSPPAVPHTGMPSPASSNSNSLPAATQPAAGLLNAAAPGSAPQLASAPATAANTSPGLGPASAPANAVAMPLVVAGVTYPSIPGPHTAAPVYPAVFPAPAPVPVYASSTPVVAVSPTVARVGSYGTYAAPPAAASAGASVPETTAAEVHLANVSSASELIAVQPAASPATPAATTALGTQPAAGQSGVPSSTNAPLIARPVAAFPLPSPSSSSPTQPAIPPATDPTTTATTTTTAAATAATTSTTTSTTATTISSPAHILSSTPVLATPSSQSPALTSASQAAIEQLATLRAKHIPAPKAMAASRPMAAVVMSSMPRAVSRSKAQAGSTREMRSRLRQRQWDGRGAQRRLLNDSSFQSLWRRVTYSQVELDIKASLPNCTECWGCNTQLRPLPQRTFLTTTYETSNGNTLAHTFLARVPKTANTSALVKMMCLPLARSNGLPACTQNPSQRRFLRASLAAQRISEECGFTDMIPKFWIDKVNAVHNDTGYHYRWEAMWLQHVEGITLKQLLRKGSPNPVEPARLLDFMHRVLNRTHVVKAAIFDLLTSQCDRHPDNLMITEKGELKLIDNEASFQYGWIGCGFDSIFLPTTRKHMAFVIGPQTGYYDRYSPLHLLDYRCYLPDDSTRNAQTGGAKLVGQLGTRYPPQVNTCLKKLSSMPVSQIQEEFGLPEMSAQNLRMRATDMLTKGFEWTLLHGKPDNPVFSRFGLQPACCKLEWLPMTRTYRCIDPRFVHASHIPSSPSPRPGILLVDARENVTAPDVTAPDETTQLAEGTANEPVADQGKPILASTRATRVGWSQT